MSACTAPPYGTRSGSPAPNRKQPFGADTEYMATDEAFSRFFHCLLAEGVYLPPSPFEAAFSSSVHGPDELARLGEALRQWVHDG